eukprot:2244406-Pleurochrysis_carterae.AAC.3
MRGEATSAAQGESHSPCPPTRKGELQDREADSEYPMRAVICVHVKEPKARVSLQRALSSYVERASPVVEPGPQIRVTPSHGVHNEGGLRLHLHCPHVAEEKGKALCDVGGPEETGTQDCF